MTWLFTTLHGEFLVARPRQHRFPHDNLEAVAAELTPMTPVLADRSDLSQVLAALAKVDEVYQAVVPLFYFEECPYKGIADILEMPIGTVKSRLARGIAQFRSVLLPPSTLP